MGIAFISYPLCANISFCLSSQFFVTRNVLELIIMTKESPKNICDICLLCGINNSKITKWLNASVEVH